MPRRNYRNRLGRRRHRRWLAKVPRKIDRLIARLKREQLAAEYHAEIGDGEMQEVRS
jgi:hypothetical protein